MSNVPKILWLKGVYLKDLVTMDHLFNAISTESSVNDKISQNSILDILHSSSNGLSDTNNEIEYIKYDKIPKVFKTLDEWPRKTNIKCLNCTLDIPGIPIPVPKNAEYTRNADYIFDIDAICCSFPCAARLITEKSNIKSLRWSKLHTLKLLKKKFNKELNSSKDNEFNKSSISNLITTASNNLDKVVSCDLPLAPKKEELCQYGGDLTIKEFKHKIIEADNYSQNCKF